jgi:hypothetical protein
VSLDTSIYDALQSLVGGRVFPDGGLIPPARPYITYQQVGGTAANFLEATPVGLRNARVQINVWADTRIQSRTLSEQVEAALMQSLRAFVLGAVAAEHVPDIKLYGFRQDFSIWYH